MRTDRRSEASTPRRGGRFALSIGFVACVGLLLSLLAFQRVLDWERREITTDLRLSAEERFTAIRQGLAHRLDEIADVRAIVMAFGSVSRGEFRQFVGTFVEPEGARLQAVSLLRRIPDSERKAYEKGIALEGFPGFRITERTPEGRIVPSRPRAEYVTIHYIEPYEGNERVLGLDVTSVPESLEALSRARDEGRPVATAPFSLPQSAVERDGVVVFFPLYRAGVSLDSVESRRANLTGFVTGVLRVRHLVDFALAHLRPAGIELALYDVSDPPDRNLLYLRRARLRTSGSGSPTEASPPVEGGDRSDEAAIHLPGRTWLAVVTPTPAFIAARATWQAPLVLAAGLLLTAMVLLQVATSRRRTERLVGINEQLAHEMRVRAEGEKKLRESEKRFRQLANHIREVFWITSADGREMIYVSPAYEEIWGRTCEHLYENPTSWAEAIDPDDRERVRRSFAENGPAGRFDEEYRILRPDGSMRWIRDRGFAIRDESGTVYRIAGIAEDITLQNRFIAELEEARRAAEESSRVKSEFLANMSHEIRTPMTSILGFADLMQEDVELSEKGKWKTALDAIARNGRHLLRLIDDILDVSRIEAGRLQIETLPCSPVEILEDVVSLFANQAEVKGLAFTVEYQGGLPDTIVTDPVRLRQILINLVSNAIKFTDEGSVSIRAFMRRDDLEGEVLHVDVSDTGPGMSPEQIARVTEPFVRGEGSSDRRKGGTGLGLTISRRLSELLGGCLQIDSRPGEGTRVSVEVATVPGHGLASQTKTELRTKGAAPVNLTGRRILVVEDSLDTQRVLSWMLLDSGAEVAIATDGKGALERVESSERAGEPFDLILMDMRLPRLDGYEATRLLRTRGFASPIIALTSYAMSGDRERCLAAGCDEYMKKPIDRARMLEMIRGRISVSIREKGVERDGQDS